jgi:hypothetical protein
VKRTIECFSSVPERERMVVEAKMKGAAAYAPALGT